MNRIVTAMICLSILLAACSSSPSPSAINTTIAQTQATWTPTAVPTQTPTDTLRPTDRPKPTNTAKPAYIPRPTRTPTPPTAPKPITLTGTGDSFVDAKKWDGPALVHIIGNPDTSSFAVTSYGADGNKIGLLVNTNDKYDGIRGLDFAGTETARFEVKATGDWTITILPMTAVRVLKVPGKIEGTGDDVILLRGGKSDIAHIIGNPASRFFTIQRWDDDKRSLLVNTADIYDGQVTLTSNTSLLEISAIGEWSIEITSK